MCSFGQIFAGKQEKVALVCQININKPEVRRLFLIDVTNLTQSVASFEMFDSAFLLVSKNCEPQILP
jgi:hypothetical protein